MKQGINEPAGVGATHFRKCERHFVEKAMASPLRISYPGAYYHLTTRGNERTDTRARETGENFSHSLNRQLNDTARLSMPTA